MVKSWENQFWKYCLTGDVQKAYKLLENNKELTEEWEDLKEQMYSRFYEGVNPITSVSSRLQPILNSFYTYYRDVLLKRKGHEEAESNLIENLSQEIGFMQQDKVELSSTIQKMFEEEGFHFLGGKTEPFYGPYIWRESEEKVYEVDLPLGKQTLKVVFMHDFIMRSWLDFATCGRKGAGGWAKEDGLYCVYSIYRDILESPKFQISYLKHEAQHVDDFERFPNLKNHELEYRAKLVEIMYEDSSRVIQQVLHEADSNPEFPHNFASYLIKEEFEKRLGESTPTGFPFADMETIKKIAEKIYMEHTEHLIERGAGNS
ncbi:hypothetical protein GCM10008967_11000 [Bacillus carboniphilus]|uniref:Uncharacterized protein n=1 Tax=Bacillus carboniphilus TaxID=86663 RepID=A0ABN0W136_9BACI